MKRSRINKSVLLVDRTCKFESYQERKGTLVKEVQRRGRETNENRSSKFSSLKLRKNTRRTRGNQREAQKHSRNGENLLCCQNVVFSLKFWPMSITFLPGKKSYFQFFKLYPPFSHIQLTNKLFSVLPIMFPLKMNRGKIKTWALNDMWVLKTVTIS
jgi:hypothetical protein